MPGPKARPFSEAESALLIDLKEKQGLVWKDVAEAFAQVFEERSAGALQVHYCRKLNKRGKKQQTERDPGLVQAQKKDEEDKLDVEPPPKRLRTTGGSVSVTKPTTKKTPMAANQARAQPQTRDRMDLDTNVSYERSTALSGRQLPRSQPTNNHATDRVMTTQEATADLLRRIGPIPDDYPLPVFRFTPESADLEAYDNFTDVEKQIVMCLVHIELDLDDETELRIRRRG